jgi:hypothetical protein
MNHGTRHVSIDGMNNKQGKAKIDNHPHKWVTVPGRATVCRLCGKPKEAK